MATRREFIKLSLATLLGAGIGAVPFFPNRAALAAPGELIAQAGTPNPNGAFEQLYWLSGDALAAPISTISGATLPLESKASKSKILRIVHFNDLHNMISLPNKKKGTTHPFSQMVSLLERRRASAGPDEVVLFLAAGDDHTGSVFDELVGWSTDEYVVDPAYTVYTAAGLDCGALGNHEFDRGAAVLRKGIREAARFPVLSANVFGSAHLESGRDYYPAVIGVSKGVRVGIIGLTTPVDTHTGMEADPGLAVGSPVEAVRNLTPILSRQVDLLVVLSHCGYGLSKSRSGKAGADRFLSEGDSMIAEAVGKASACAALVIGGHTHTVLNEDGLSPENVVGGVPIVQAGGRGSHVGEVSLALGRGDRPVEARLHRIRKSDIRMAADDPKYSSLEHDGDFDAAFEQKHVAPLLANLESKMAGEIGTVKDNPPVTTDEVFAARYIGEMELANFMNDALAARSATFPEGRVDVSLFNATGFASGIPASGPLTFQDWYNVMPFADTVFLVEMTGRQIAAMLDSNAKRLVRPEELKGGGVDVAGYVSRGFLHFSAGLRYSLRLNGSAAQATATDITIGGMGMKDAADKTFRVAMNSYVAAGAYGESWNGNPIGGGVPGSIKGFDIKSLPKIDTGLVYRNEIIARIKELSVLSPGTGLALDGRLKVV
ncbi:bifunctional metallophosphatase/5'-nucleotidase [Desulfovibrio sp. Fe33]|uniref:bifunctional metallophosphatase/5'-nucleotidase n=1 Tax=Desulfovibrio sp. Fe33 TaxID=3020842 RepID=UPI00234C3BC2|nr:5'-nucleotidase C-terminal domain-containing protein [Desulfovibrio sp. Fe33]